MSQQLIALTDTWLKREPIQASILTAQDKVFMKRDEELQVQWFKDVGNGHYQCEVSPPVNGRHNWYLWKADWERPINDQRLNVPYFYQGNNSTSYHGSGWRQCNLTSHAMALEFLTKGRLSKLARANGFDEPEGYYGKLLAKYGDTTDHDAHTKCLRNEFDIESTWRYDLSVSDVKAQIDKALPVPAGVAYRSSGHIIVFTGYNDDGFWAHDPYGSRHGSSDSYTVGPIGEDEFYSWSLINAVFLVGLPNGGWGRLFTV